MSFVEINVLADENQYKNKIKCYKITFKIEIILKLFNIFVKRRYKLAEVELENENCWLITFKLLAFVVINI